jgi:hypothetical protein
LFDAIKVKKIGLKKKDGYLYFIDRDGDISMTKMNRGAMMAKKKKKTAKKKKKSTAKKKKKATKKKAKKKRKK